MSTVIEITDISHEQLDIYARYNEVQLLRYNEPDEGIFIAESPMIIERALDAGYEPISFLMERRFVEGQGKGILERCPEAPVFVADVSVMTKLTGYQITRGVLCAMRRKRLAEISTVCE